jgi:antirestriction protein ArdC
MKSYAVFNGEQIDGLPQRFYETTTTPLPMTARIAAAESFAGRTGATIRHGGNHVY